MALKKDSAPGAVYGESHPDGPWIHDRNLPPGAPQQPLHFRVSDDGRVVGKGQVTGHAQYWTGARWLELGPTTGNNIAAFGPNGTVYVAHIDGVRIYDRAGNQIGFRPGYVGSNGIRWVDAAGTVITGDSTYAGDGMMQWTEVNGVRIGQGPDGGVRVRVDGILRWVVQSGWAEFIRVNAKDWRDTFSICYFTKPTANVRVTATLADLRACPAVGTPPPPPPVDPDEPDEPEPPPVSIPNLSHIVKAIDQQHPHLIQQNNAETIREFYWRAAVALHAADPKFGMLTKSAGENHHVIAGHRVSVDAVTYKDTDKVVDIIGSAGDGPGTGRVTWGIDDRRPTNLWLKPPPFEDEEPPPPPPPIDDIPARVDALEQKLAETLREFAVMRGQFDAMNPTRIVRELAIMRDDMDDLQKLIREIDLGSGVTVDEIIQQVGVNVGRSFSHSHPASLVKK